MGKWENQDFVWKWWNVSNIFKKYTKLLENVKTCPNVSENVETHQDFVWKWLNVSELFKKSTKLLENIKTRRNVYENVQSIKELV